ncbi:MAG: ATP-binding protein [Burkholderiaceae bacterium]|nr:ATP-binding protein [Burkholderiaceae bacterium]
MTISLSIVERLEILLQRLEPLLPPLDQPDFRALAFQWRRRSYLGASMGRLEAVRHIAKIGPEDLKHIDAQKQAILRNTEQFVRGLPANNVLLTGARGTGKSSLVRACLSRYAADGLRLIEVDRHDLIDLPQIAERLEGRLERFVLFCDDLSFEPSDATYKALKAALDGSLAGPGDNTLIYATSNRRHLMPEFMRENLQAAYDDNGELHPAESTEEKVSLSERFGLWLSFHPFRQEDFLDIVDHWLACLGVDPVRVPNAHAEALQFALARGSRSGRIAQQFARDFAGRAALAKR